VGAGHVVDGDPHLLAGAPVDEAAGEPAEPDLRSLQVGQDAHGVAFGVRGLAHHVVDALVVVPVAVAEVQPGDVHPGLNELPDPVRTRGGGTDGADDLRASAHVTRV
jgi:hypothetical protein